MTHLFNDPPIRRAEAPASSAINTSRSSAEPAKPAAGRRSSARVLATLAAALVCPALLAIAAPFLQGGGVNDAYAESRRADAAALPVLNAELARIEADAPPQEAGAGGDVCVLATLAMPPEALKRIAADAAALRIPLVLRGLPMTAARSPDDPPYRLDKAKAQALLKPVVEAGASVEIDPNRFRRAFGRSAGQAPALFIAAEGELEVFPGEVRPRFALAWAAQNAGSAAVRAAAKAVLESAGLPLMPQEANVD